jgi:hypothetical protein
VLPGAAARPTTVDLLGVAIYDDATLTRPSCSYEASRLRLCNRMGDLNLMELRIH